MDRPKKKVSLSQVLHLIDQLPADKQEQLRDRLNYKVSKQSAKNSEPHSFLDWRIDIDALAAQQGVQTTNSIADLKGDFWPEDDLEEFLATIRQWRRESTEQRLTDG